MKIVGALLVVFLGMLLVRPLQGQQQPTPNARATLHAQLRAQIGGDAVPEAYVLNRVADIAASAAGEIYVLDSGDFAVKVYDPAGRFLRRFGRQGSGPGEFGLPLAISVDSLVRVVDFRLRRVSSFTLQGAHVETRALPTMANDLRVGDVFEMRGGGVLRTSIAMFSITDPDHHDPRVTVEYVLPDGRSEPVIAYRSGGTVWHPVGGTVPWGGLPTDFGDGGSYAVSGDSLFAVIDGYSGEVRWYSVDGRGEIHNVRRGRVELASPAVSQGDLERAERLYRESGSVSPEFPNRVAFLAPPRWSIASRALFDEQGGLWVRSSVGSHEGFVWTVFPVGGPARVIRLIPNFDLLSISRDRLYGIAKSAHDADRVWVLDYEWR